MSDSPIYKIYGLIGFPLSHSFSPAYFEQKFKKSGISDCQYKLFPLSDIDKLKQLLANEPGLCGLNVTIPYKQSVIPYLDSLEYNAERLKAVNTIRVFKDGRLRGYNTDYFGFLHALLQNAPFFKWKGIYALVFGSGGSSAAICAVLADLEVNYLVVSRNPEADEISYQDANARLSQCMLLVNCTPLGMFPESDTFPPIDYGKIKSGSFAIDLVYNPAETMFMKLASENGAIVQNGLNMLEAQADKAWEIWNQAETGVNT